MKKLVASILLLLIFTSAKSQLELKAGANFSPRGEITHKIYPLVGIAYNQSLSQKFSLRYELLFIHYKLKNGDVSNAAHFPLTVNFLVSSKLNLHAGIEYAVGLIRYEIDDNRPDLSLFTKYSRQTDLGIVLGMQYTISKHMGLFGRYSHVNSFDNFQIGTIYRFKQMTKL